MKKATKIAIATSLIILITTPTIASEFGEKAATVWVARNSKLISETDKVIAYNEQKQKGNADLGSYLPNVRAACSGLTGELIANGGRNMPVWAQTAQQKFCLGSGRLENSIVDAGASALMTNRGTANKDYCGDLKAAVNYARKAKQSEETPELYNSAMALADAAERLMATDFVVTKWSILGTSNLHLKCK
jgi:hypothetical protein